MRQERSSNFTTYRGLILASLNTPVPSFHSCAELFSPNPNWPDQLSSTAGMPDMSNVNNNCNMGMGDLPDMCARSSGATGPEAETESMHIRQITRAHVTSNK